MQERRAFTLIELIITIAIVVVLVAVTVLVLNPAESLRQGRDARRVADLSTLGLGVSTYYAAQLGSLGSSSVLYISIPDPLATTSAGDQCQGLGLSSAISSTGYTYHCAASSSYKNIDGTGWIPLNFKAIRPRNPLSILPVDPVNSSSSGLYYSYTTNGTKYEVTAGMESVKYKKGGSSDVVSNDGGNNIDLDEKGTNLALEPLDYGPTTTLTTGPGSLNGISGLVAYYPLDEATGSVALDGSGNGANGTWAGTKAGMGGSYYSLGKVGLTAGTFNGTDDLITATVPNIATATGTANTVSFWMNYTSLGRIAFSLGQFNYYMSGGNCNGINAGGAVYGAAAPTSSQWVDVTLVLYNGIYDSNGSAMYYNGSLVPITCDGGAASGFASSTFIMGSWFGGGLNFPGQLDDIRIYNRALTPAEIMQIYTAEQ